MYGAAFNVPKQLQLYSAALRRCITQHAYVSCASLSTEVKSAYQDLEFMDFPGGSVPITHSMKFIGGEQCESSTKVPCYRTLGPDGAEVAGAHIPHPIGQQLAVKLYQTMAGLQTMDTMFYEAQRQGRFSFYMTSSGEEATAIGSAAALSKNDMVFTQYREQGVLYWRGYSFLDFANQCYGNHHEPGKGRQMPIHYGSQELNFQTVSSPLATQLPHAVGVGYAYKLSDPERLVAAYFGEGAASEGDFHAALNFAATLEVPSIFICRNNGYAISTPAYEQYKGDGIAARGPAYYAPTIRVDGGDVQAVYNATRQARIIAMEQSTPVLIEAMMYRSGHHSTSDDSSRYRTMDEMKVWRARDPVVRWRTAITGRGWWDDGQEQGLRKQLRQQVLLSLDQASKAPKPPLSDLFTDVYSTMPWHLKQQMKETFDFVRKHPGSCPPDIPVPDLKL